MRVGGWQVCTFRGHYWRGVHSVSFSPDGKRIVSAMRNNGVKILNAETGDVVSSFVEGRSVGMGGVCVQFPHAWPWKWSEIRVGGRCAR